MNTKTLFSAIAFLAFSAVCTAQLKVDNSGRVIFGKQPYGTAISIVDETTTTASWNNPFRITLKSNEMVTLSRHSSYGMMFAPTGSILIGYNLPANSHSMTPLEVYGYDMGGGIKVNHTASYTSYPGISVVLNSNSTYSYEAMSGSARKFYVTGGGVVYANGNQLTSDVRLKNEIETIQSPLEKVLQLRGVTFKMNLPKTDGSELTGEELWQLMKKRTPEITPEIFKQVQEEKNRKQMGVIAQEVEKVVPEVIRTREDGLKSVAYTELVGLLIEAIKELKAEVDELKGEPAVFRSSTGISGLVQQCALTQNAPNPFTDLTEIKYFVANGVKDAYICVFDMQGKMLQKINVSAGQNSITIQGATLPAGMYLYSLIADGQEVDTKRMILTR